MTQKNKLTMADYARLNGLEIVELDGMPARYDGHLDPTNNKSSYIAINRNLVSWERSLVIGREIGYFAQEQRWPSMILDRPWKWEALSAAPDNIRELILRFDAEFRAGILMLHYTQRDEFRDYFKKTILKSLTIDFWNHLVVQSLLIQFRVQNWIYKFFYVLALS
ncbi:MAG: hypothetical protein ACREC8_07110 [Limisphaerales bacterium]